MDAETLDSRADAATGDAEARLAEAVDGVFGARCKAAWLSGSFVYDGARAGRSDIDIVVVLDESAAVPADEATLARIRAFVDSYLAVHAREGLDPDLDFPGEYVVPATLAEAIAWRGLAQGGAVAEAFPPVESPGYWLGRPDRWFHAWLSMTAFSQFLAGNRGWHSAMKLAAWKTVARFLLLRSGGGSASAEALRRGLGQFGIKPRYRGFWGRERAWLDRALAGLEREGEVEIAGAAITPDLARLRGWERRLAAAIAVGGEAPLLLPPALHREVGAYAAKRWAGIGR